MKLNLEKYAFGVGSGKFLGFMVSNRGIEINPDKIKAIEAITVVDSVKSVQRSYDKSHQFFLLLNKKNNFSWTPERQHALEELKRHLSSQLLCHTLKVHEQLYLYLARNEYIDYLKTGKLPSNPKESRALRIKVARFSLPEDTLYRRTFDGPLAICLGPGDTEYIFRKVHEGTCGNHSGVESLVRKIIRVGYYWIDMEKDARDFVQKCDGC
uniref:Uncharacterized protein LOC104238828 n=1 Tax=Nicotiana sylvestris TaxID=4096 RepID=A0A1U7XPQ7_NICSY|nr:PREDICTED: uncharacterized protein LOC104238828 [Nicotiana sylvestris]